MFNLEKAVDSTTFSRFKSFFLCLLISTGLHAEAVLYPTQGKPIPFSQLRGKWVLMNYWASWCAPCLDEIPELNRLHQQSDKKKLELFAVNYDMQPANMQQQLAMDHHIRYTALRKDPAKALKLGDIRGVPVTFIFNPQGILIETLYGGQTANRLKKRLRDLAGRSIW